MTGVWIGNGRGVAIGENPGHGQFWIISHGIMCEVIGAMANAIPQEIALMSVKDVMKARKGESGLLLF